MDDLLMKYYKDERCPACYKKFKEGDQIVVCPDCGAPYHKDCYNEIGECKYKSDHGEYIYTNDHIEYIKALNSNEYVEDKQVNDDDQVDQDEIKCPYCEELNNHDSKLCKHCGMPLEIGPGMLLMGKENIDSEEKISGISVKDWLAYLGSSALAYLIKFRSIEKKRYSLLEFNISAFLFNEFYFLYRKMYVISGLFCLLRMFITTTIISMFLPDNILQSISRVSSLSSYNLAKEELIAFLSQNPQIHNYILFGWFVLAIIMGAIATRIYQKVSIRKIKSVDRKIYVSDEVYRNVLLKKGSVNYIAVCIFSFILLLLLQM